MTQPPNRRLRDRARQQVAVPDQQDETAADRAKRRAGEAIQAMEAQFQLAMPKGADAAQLVRDAMTLLSNNPDLATCNPRSLLGGLMTCAQLGLRPGLLGQAWLIPFGGQATLVVGYLGLVSLAQRSGDIRSITAHVVYENDELDVVYGTEDRLHHKPFLKGDRGEPVGYYAVVKSVHGGVYWDFLTKEDAERHRDKFAMQRTNNPKRGKEYVQSSRGDWISGPWVEHFDAMATKTALIKALRYAPRNTDIQRAFEVDGTVRLDATPTVDPTQASIPASSMTVPGDLAENEEDAPASPPAGTQEPDADASPTPASAAATPITPTQLGHIGFLFKELGVVGGGSQERRTEMVSNVLRRPVAAAKDLTAAEADRVIAWLEKAGQPNEEAPAPADEGPPAQEEPDPTLTAWRSTPGQAS